MEAEVAVSWSCTKSKERVERNGAGAFLISVDSEYLMKLREWVSSQELVFLGGCWVAKLRVVGDGKVEILKLYFEDHDKPTRVPLPSLKDVTLVFPT